MHLYMQLINNIQYKSTAYIHHFPNKQAGYNNGTVQLKCNFTHAWRSTHGYMQIFAYKFKKIFMEIFIFTRRRVAQDIEYHGT